MKWPNLNRREKIRLCLYNRLEEVAKLQERLESILRERSVSTSVIQDVLLICEEVLVGISRFAYPETSPSKETEVSISVEARKSIFLQFCDEGVPYNLLHEPSKGDDFGWSLELIKALSHRQHYVRRYGYNIVELVICDLEKEVAIK